MSGTVERVYDNHMRVIGQTVNFNTNEQVNFGFDADGFMTDAGALTMSRNAQHGLLMGTALGEVTDSYERNGFGEVTGYAASIDGTPVLEIDYERDQVGRITRKTESVEGGSPVDTYYVSDPAGRLQRVCDDEPVDGECTSKRAEYEYDLNSNRTGGHDQVSGSITATYDSQDRLLSYNGATYTYTANGELASKTDSSGTTTYDYDALGNLRRVVLPAEDPNEAQVIDYLIDGRNRRIGKKVDGTLVQAFLYENQLRPVAELDGSGNVVSRFVYAEKVNVAEYVIKNSAIYRIVTDHLGSPRLIANTVTGDVVQAIAYDEFGNVLHDTNPGFQPFGFAGGIYDLGTKLTRYGVRDYDARTGRWTAKDPIGFDGRDPNLYTYVWADPINWVDPSGQVGKGYAVIFGANAPVIAALTAFPTRIQGYSRIYLALEKTGGKTLCYIGRSVDLGQRAAQHGSRFFEYYWHSDLLIKNGEVLFENVAGFEQGAINGLGGITNLGNSRNEVKALIGSPVRTIASMSTYNIKRIEHLTEFVKWAKTLCR